MYSEGDIDAAVAAGALDPAAARRLRDFVATQRAAPAADEESFRLVTGFNDIFVSISASLLLLAVAWIGGSLWMPLGGLATAAAAWGLAEYFTRIRRMALPSILLLLSFVGGLFAGGMALLGDGIGHIGSDMAGEQVRPFAFALSGAAALAAGGAWAHWRRFHVPITVAAGAAGAVALAIGLFLSLVPAAAEHARLLTFLCGVAVFLLAMRWDMSDPARTTRRSDVAFWLHLLAAPLIVHPVFSVLGLLRGAGSPGAAGAVLLLYLALAAVALGIDRRALMASALVYVLYAINSLLDRVGSAGLSVAFTGLVIGSALLLLSAFWQPMRRLVIGALPEDVARRLPPVRELSPRSAS